MFIYFNSVIKRLTFCLLVGLCILKGMIYVVGLPTILCHNHVQSSLAILSPSQLESYTSRELQIDKFYDDKNNDH